MASILQKAARDVVSDALFGPRGESRSSLNNPQTPLSFPAEWLLDIFNGGRTDSGIRVSEMTALQVSTVLSCINVITRGVTLCPLHVFEKKMMGNRVAKVKAHDHYLYDILKKEPNPEMTQATFIRTFIAHALLWGNGYAEITRRNNGQVFGIWPRNPYLTIPQRLVQKEFIDGDWHPRGTLVYTTTENFDQAINEDGTITQSGPRRIILAENMIHVPGLSLDGRIGQSTIWMSRQIIGLALAAEKYSAQFFGNGAVPRGILEIPNEMEPKAVEELKRQWHEGHGGQNQHKVGVLTQGMKFTNIAFNAEQSQLLETRKFQRGEIAALFNVPGHMVGDTNEKGKSNVEQSSIEFLTYTLQPWLIAMEQEFERKMFPDMGQTANKFFPKFDTHLLKYPDAATRATLFNGGKQWGYLNTNDIHEFEDLNPVPGAGGERYWMPINMQDADDPQTLGANAQVDFDKANPEHSSIAPPTPPVGGIDPNKPLGGGGAAKAPAAKAAPTKPAARSLLKPFQRTMKDAIGRIAHRNENNQSSSKDIEKVFKPLLLQAADTAKEFGYERSDTDIDVYMRTLEVRSAAWRTSTKDQDVAFELTNLGETFFDECRDKDEKGHGSDPHGGPQDPAAVMEALGGKSGSEGVNDTKNANFDKANGQYTEQRQAQHDTTVSKIIGDRQPPTGRPPTATVAMGGTASGKSTATKEIMGESPNVVRLDPDEVKTHIPEYEALKIGDPQNAAARVHAESSDVTRQALRETVAGRYDMVYDSTTSGDKGLKTIDNLAAQGYKVNAIAIDIPLKMAMDRADLRARTSEDPISKGRFVPKDIIVDTHVGAARNFVNSIKDSPNVGLKQMWDNSQPKGQPPTLVYERQGMGEEKIYDAAKWSAYVDKANGKY